MNEQCRICGSVNTHLIQKVRDTQHYADGEWRLVRCSMCSVYFLANPPNEKEIGKFYPQGNYYTHTLPLEDTGLLRIVYDHYFGIRRTPYSSFLFSIVRPYVNMLPHKPTSGNDKLLDFGCGNGTLLKRFSRYGFVCEGFEVDKYAADFARKEGFIVHNGDFFSLSPSYKYNVVILNQVLEHLHDPVRIVRHIRKMLLPDGELIVSVPDISCLDFKIMGDRWSGFQAPTHLFHYNKRSLYQMLCKAGFKIRRMQYSSGIAGLDPNYIKYNLKKIRTDGWRKALFLASSIASVIPLVNHLKRRRITAYAQVDRLKYSE